MEHHVLSLETGPITVTQMRHIEDRIRKLLKLKRVNEFNDGMYNCLLERAEAEESNFREFEVRGGRFPNLIYLARDYISKDREKIHLGSQRYKHAEILDLKV